MTDRLWSKTPRTLYITNDQVDITTVWRCFWPCSELTRRGYVADTIPFGQLNMAWSLLESQRYNCVVTPRMGFHSSEHEHTWLTIAHKLRSLGIKWVFDCDDNLFTDAFVERHIKMNAVHSDQPDKVIEIIHFERDSRLRILQQADAITVSTPYLASIVQALTQRPVMIVPNGINSELFLHRIQQAERLVPGLTVGWSGGPRLEVDLEPLYEVWTEVARLRPQVRFIMQGWTPDSMLKVLPDLIALPGVAFDDHAAMVKNIDIFCCVAKTDAFNSAKSAIKFYEASLADAACVTSNDVYGEANSAGYCAQTPEQWVHALITLIDDSQKRQAVAAAAKQHVLENFTLKQTYPYWLDAWAQ